MTTLVFLHGWGAHGGIWRKQVEEFGGDLVGGRGQGPLAPAPSPKPPPPTPYEGIINKGTSIGESPSFSAEYPHRKQKTENRKQILTPTIPAWDPAWLKNYLQNLPMHESIVVGWSLGGMLLLEVLPDLATPPAGLVLVGVSAVFCRRPDFPWGQPPAALRAMRRALPSHPWEVLRDFAQQCLAPGEERFQEEIAAFLAPEVSAAPALAQGLDYLSRQDARPYLPRLSSPVAIIQGDQDRIVPPAQARFLHEQLPLSKLFLLPGAGHLPFWTQAARFNRILADFALDR